MKPRLVIFVTVGGTITILERLPNLLELLGRTRKSAGVFRAAEILLTNLNLIRKALLF